MLPRIMRPSLAGCAALLIGVSGCKEPREIVPVAPPGVALERIPAVPSTPAEAIGEAGTSNTNPAKPARASASNAANSPPTPLNEPRKTPSGLEYVTLKEGSGATALSGQTIRMHYVGTLEDGSKFDSSRDRGKPFEVAIGTGQVIRGWDEGVPGMKVGEVRKLTIPGPLAYGARSPSPKIPANATLIFEVELLGID